MGRLVKRAIILNYRTLTTRTNVMKQPVYHNSDRTLILNGPGKLATLYMFHFYCTYIHFTRHLFLNNNSVYLALNRHSIIVVEVLLINNTRFDSVLAYSILYLSYMLPVNATCKV